jgi:hypothetical protein
MTSSSAKVKKVKSEPSEANPKDTVKADKKKQPKTSKRGANEDSEVRYDKKHVLKKENESSKKKRKTNSSGGVDPARESGDQDEVASFVSGNEDDKGSVTSAILDEDICYECGLSTLNGEEWNNVIMCDMCDGEYHLQCQHLSAMPEGSFVCTKCVADEKFYKDLRFEVSDSFKVSALSPCTAPLCVREQS